MKIKKYKFLILLPYLLLLSSPALSQVSDKETELDRKVRKFLDDWKYRWRDMNVPEVDGQTLFDIIVKNGYKRGLEVGTSTGHSAIWIAWAFSKTGGNLFTVEINRRRYEQAVENFKDAGLSEYIEARLADAHELVPEIEGPFDFVFIDADKNWYTNYAKAIVPKLELGGCLTAHNVYESRSRWRRRSGTGGFLEYIKSLPDFETTVDSRGNGLSISYKKREK